MEGIVASARLISLTLERFKSYKQATRIDLSPLTVILGRNNSGKSSIIQALLLLKQTLALPRPDVPLHLEGYVDALHLRELTYGWPAPGADVPGPRIGLRWASRINVHATLEQSRAPDPLSEMAKASLSSLLASVELESNELVTELLLDYAELEGRVVLQELTLTFYSSAKAPEPTGRFTLTRQIDGIYKCVLFSASGEPETASGLQVELDHFIPYLFVDRRNVDQRDRQQFLHTAFHILFYKPLDDLKALLAGFAYLGAMRTLPPSLYRPATAPPDDIGVSGEYAAQMLHARRADRVHYLPPLHVDGDRIEIPAKVRSLPLADAVNDVLDSLGVGTSLRIDDVKDIGFRLLFGNASFQHVGRGLSYLVPVIQLGLITDPLRFRPLLDDMPLEDYEQACPGYTHCAFEEPEAHLHPKVQTRLAHWLVSLAMSRRQILVETHSDHLVRRLRGLAARAEPGSPLERWLLKNVRVLQVEQHDGESIVKSAGLTPQGGLEDWPADFMDEATDEERSIYYASLDKPAEPAPEPPELPAIEHDVGEEPDVGP